MRRRRSLPMPGLWLSPLLALLLAACGEHSGPVRSAAVRVEPATAVLRPGEAMRLVATVRDDQGLVVEDPAVAWSSSDTAVVAVDADGVATALAPGETFVRAVSAGDTAAVALTVGYAVLVGAGDVAACSSPGDEATARLLDGIAGTVFTVGDNAYPDGSLRDFAICYHRSWGRHRRRTRPAPGNHDYHTDGAAAYFDYFGANAGDPRRGYYSYELGEWHVVVLNSNVDVRAGSPQERWLRADLAAHPARCTLAYLHISRFSSGKHSAGVEPLWQALYEAGADVVLSGHDHSYERFAPQTPTGERDDARGIRAFVVGTGGSSLYDARSAAPNSEVRNDRSYGVLKLELHADRYEWEFVPVPGPLAFSDAGAAACH